MSEPLLSIHDLSVGLLARDRRPLPILRNVSLSVRRGETIGIVGESGSGKSTLALAAMGYLKHGLHYLGGSVRFDGVELVHGQRDAIQSIRGGRMALIPQNAAQSLTPTMRICDQISEALRLHTTLPANEYRQRIISLIEKVRLPDAARIIERFPHELSGGQQQRVAIAMALAGEPDLLLLDEPTTGLDVTTQAHILELLDDLATAMNMAMVYVSHDLGAIARVCRRVVVMYAGEIVMDGSAEQVLRNPRHPYAKSLLAAIPRVGDAALPAALDGRPPAPGSIHKACSFAARCALKTSLCEAARPDILQQSDGSWVRCIRAPDVDQWSPPIASRSSTRSNDDREMLAISNVAIDYSKRRLLDSLFRVKRSHPPTVEHVDLVVQKGETLALVGESGSGKSSLLKAVAGLVPTSHGSVSLARDGILSPSVEQRTKDELRKIQLVFQNPDESLNPRQTIAEILAQPLRLYTDLGPEEIMRRSIAMLERVRLSAHYMGRLPAQLSGGEKQRVAIARAFIAGSEVLLCDEVTSALDVSVQAAVLQLLDELKAESGVTYLFVAHDLAVVRAIADRVAVLYQGRLCEIGPVDRVYQAPHHPYTEALLAAVLEPVPGTRPSLLAQDIVEFAPPKQGCPFQRRCHRSLGEICKTSAPPPQQIGRDHLLYCHIGADELTTMQSQSGGHR